MPLLLHLAGRLTQRVASAWAAHPQAGGPWQRSVDILTRAAPCAAGSLLQTIDTLLEEAQRAGTVTHAGDVAARNMWEAIARRGDPPGGVPLHMAVSQTQLAGDYIPPLAQEVILLQYGSPSLVREIHALEQCFRAEERLVRQPGACEFRWAPDQEVQWWVDRLLAVLPAHIACALEEVPMYSQYIVQSTMVEVVRDALVGLEGYRDSPMSAGAACEVSPRLGATMPLRLAVALTYAGVTTAKPT